jgi:hypothetical protein
VLADGKVTESRAFAGRRRFDAHFAIERVTAAMLEMYGRILT